MTDQADTQTAPFEQPGNPSAGNQELSIPKHRFDEVLQRMRTLEQASQQKDQLLMQLAQQQRQPQQPQGLTAEAVGLDPDTFQKMQTIIQHTVQNERRQFEGLLGEMANRQDTSDFLLTYGQDKQAYLPRIQEYQREYMQKYKTFLPVDAAYKMVRADEMDRRIAQQPRGPVQGQMPQQQYSAPPYDPYTQEASYPSAQGTRLNNGPVAPPAAKPFSEMTAEEMEAHLDGGFAKNGPI